MRHILLKTLASAGAVALALGGTAHAQIVGQSSDTNNVQVGASNVVGGPHTAGKAGIGVPSSALVGKVDFQGLKSSVGADANGVSTVNKPSAAPSDHSSLGVFHFAQVGNADLYFGEWSQAGGANAGDHTVYYAGNSAGTTVPTSGTATYNVKGISDYSGKGVLTGTFTAAFASGSSGTIKGSVANSASGFGVNIGTASISGATFLGNGAKATQGSTTLASNGTVSGRFFGANAAALAGIVNFGSGASRQYNAAFGGTKN